MCLFLKKLSYSTKGKNSGLRHSLSTITSMWVHSSFKRTKCFAAFAWLFVLTKKDVRTTGSFSRFFFPFQMNIKALFRTFCWFLKKQYAPCPDYRPVSNKRYPLAYQKVNKRPGRQIESLRYTL